MKAPLLSSVLSVALLIAGTSPSVAGQNKKALLDRPNANKAARQNLPGLELVTGLYISALQQQPDFSDEQKASIAPLLKEYLRARTDISGPRRTRVMNVLRTGVNRGATDEELTKAIQELDRIEAEAVAARQRFFAGADPLLNVKQRARLRLFEINMENRVGQLIQLSKSPNPPPPLNRRQR